MEENSHVVILNIDFNATTVRVDYLINGNEYLVTYEKEAFYKLIKNLVDDLKNAYM